MIPELVRPQYRTDFRNASTFVLHLHKTCFRSCPRNKPRAFAWAVRNDRNRAGRATGMGIECSRFARRLRLQTLRRRMCEGFQPGIEIGVPSSVRKGLRSGFCVCAMRFPACGSAWKMDSGSPENSGPRIRRRKTSRAASGRPTVAGTRMRRRGHGATSFAFCATRNCGV